MKTSKRLLSILLMLAMLVSMFTVMAFADDDITVTVNVVGANETNGGRVKFKLADNYQTSNFTAAGTRKYFAAGTFDLVADCAEGYTVNWNLDGTASTGKELSLKDITADASVIVTFTKNDSGSTEDHADRNVTVTIIGSGTVKDGDTVVRNNKKITLTESSRKTLTAVLDAGATVCWNLDDTKISYDNEFTFAWSDLKKAGSNLTVTFVSMDPVPNPDPEDPDTHTLTVKADSSRMGYVKCGTEKKASITKELVEFEKYTFEAVAKDGYRFVNWEVTSGDASISDKKSATTTITMGKKVATVTAYFESDEYYGNDKLYVNITNASRGTVKFRGDDDVDNGDYFWLRDGKTYTIYATAKSGYTAYWYYNGTRDYGRSFTFEMDEDCENLYVEFVRDGYRPSYDDDSHTLTIDITGAKHGTVKRGSTTVKDGDTMSLDKNETRTFKATPDKGYVAVWTFQGETYVGNSYTVKMGSKNATLYIEFMDEDDYRLTKLPFRDVSEKDWYYDDVAYVYRNGYMEGISSTKFAPNQNTTRGQIVTILWRLTGEPRAARSNKFTDVSSSMYYDKAISWAAEAGIVEGFDAKTFKPDANVTREQLAAILYRYAEYMNLSTKGKANLTKYDDYSKIGSWAKDAMAWANYHGLINGVSSYRIDPKGYATRAQIAAILHRFAVEFGA